MKIELKGLKILKGHGDSQAYEATVMVDGQRAFQGSNDGWGGPDMFNTLPGYGGPGAQEVSEWLGRNTPQITSHGVTFSNSLDLVVGEIVETEARRKETQRVRGKLDRLQLKEVVILDEGVIYTLRTQPTALNIQKIQARPKFTGQIVNGREDLQEAALRAYCPQLFNQTEEA